jgi:hypothetical protein
MKNVTKILTAVVLCAAVFASTQRTDALGGNPAFWPGDEANIAAFPAQLSNHGYVQVSNMGNGQVDVDGSMVDAMGSVGMVFNHGGHTWGLSFSDSAQDFMNLSWGKEGMGLSLNYKMWQGVGANAVADTAELVGNEDETYHTWNAGSGEVFDSCTGGTSDGTEANVAECDAVSGTWGGAQAEVPASCSDGDAADQAACELVIATAETFTCDDANAGADCDNSVAATSGDSMSGYKLSFGYDLGDMGEIGVHMASGDGHDEGFSIDYRKSCGFWVFTDMVANIDSPKDGDMTLDVDWFGHMDAGVADVMLATGVIYDMADNGGMTLTSNLGVEAAVTDNITLRGGMNWAYDLTNDADAPNDNTGADAASYSWMTGAGINFGSFDADFTLGTDFWNNPLGWVSGSDDDAQWSNLTVTYSF